MSQPEPDQFEGPEELLLQARVPPLSAAEASLLAERLFEAGASDVYQTPAFVAGNGQAVNFCAVAPLASRDDIEHIFMTNSRATSVIALPVDRTVARLDVRTVTTRWGDIHLHLKIWRDQVIEVVPDETDCVEIARESNAPVRLVRDEANRLGEVFVGQRLVEES